MLLSSLDMDKEPVDSEAKPWTPRVWSVRPLLGISALIGVLARKASFLLLSMALSRGPCLMLELNERQTM
jgi:hypothetical protein